MRLSTFLNGVQNLFRGYRVKNWETILKILYEHEDNWEYFADGNTGIVDDHPLVEEAQNAGISTSNAKAGMSFLQEHELIYQTSEGTYRLTTEGFQTAKEQEMRRTQAFQNRILVILTVVIALTAVLEYIV